MARSTPLDSPDRLIEAGMGVADAGVLVGRIHLPPEQCSKGIGGSTPVAIRPDGVFDLTSVAATMSSFLDRPDAALLAATASLPRVGALEDVLTESHHTLRRPTAPYFLAPVDLQVIKACGVTFAVSLIERVIEQFAEGHPDRAAAVRATILAAAGGNLEGISAGSDRATVLLEQFRAAGISSTYLEVGLGPYGEVFTKAPVLSSVGTGQMVQIRDDSSWNNPEPEIVLIVNGRGTVVGASLGNDVNLRDLEGRSPLLLGIAKDNNASCSIGPWIRLFDGDFTLDQLMVTSVAMEIDGADGFHSLGESRLEMITRHPLDLVDQAGGRHHQYPDGFALFLGTMLVPSQDRAGDGQGFAHRRGDRVRISNPLIGTLVNWVGFTGDAPPWTEGLANLFENLAARRLIGAQIPGAVL